MSFAELSLNELQTPEIMNHWKRLAIGTGQADPCCCAPAWNLAYHAIFHPDARVKAMISANGLIIFYEHQLRDGSTVLFPLEDSWMFAHPLLGVDSHLLLFELLRSYGFPLPGIAVSGIQEDSLHAKVLFRRFSPLYDFFKHDVLAQCSASLQGGVDGWLSRRSGNFRAKLKKARRKGSHFSFERHQPQSATEANSLYQRMLAVEEKSWKGIDHCGMAEPPSREFYGALIAELSKSGNARVIIAKDEDKDIGFIFGSCLGPCYRGQQFSFDQDYADYSPGNLMQFEKIVWLCEDGIKHYDMGPITGPRMAYKEHWTEEKHKMCTWFLKPRN